MINPLISVVIPSYNRKRMVERLIKSLLRGKYKNIQIIVVDDASSDFTSNYLRQKFINNRKVSVIRNKKNLFAAGAKNVGLSKAKGKYVAFIDDDNVTDSNTLEEMVRVLEENNEIGQVGPVNYNFNFKDRIIWSRATRNMLTTKTFHQKNLKGLKNKNYWETDDIPNAFMVKAKILKENKIKFREKFGIMYEESDFAYRIRKSGYKIVVAGKSKIYHDIEDEDKRGVKKDYMFHFMQDNRRPFVFARNRLIFHKLYSTPSQLLFILFFWVWVFTAYYIFKFISYDGFGNFTFKDKAKASLFYFLGTLDGFRYALFNAYKV